MVTDEINISEAIAQVAIEASKAAVKAKALATSEGSSGARNYIKKNRTPSSVDQH